MNTSKYTVGIDYGTDSVRSVLVDTSNGKELADSVFYYTRWKQGKYCLPAANRFRQHPLDYVEGLEHTVLEILAACSGETIANIVAISVDTTGSTPAAVNREGVPLALTDGFEENPDAMFVLWKDHTSVKEAEEINALSHSWGGVDYTKYEGGIYSSEWFWSKILHILRTARDVREAAYSWVEHCDWIPALLTGFTDPQLLKRSRCAAGHKAMWHPDWNGLPSEEFLIRLDPLLKGLRSRLYQETYTSDIPAGTISRQWADKLGLPDTVKIGVGAFDAHLGAVGGEIKPYYLSKVMGTSTCDMLVAPAGEVGNTPVQGICGQVDGSVIPGLIGLEAGQSAFGDIYAWFRNILMWPVESLLKGSSSIDDATKNALTEEIADRLIPELSKAAEEIPVEESGVLALDWMNGRRTPDASQALKGAVTGLTLGSDAPKIFRALVEATAFGAKAIVDRFRDEGMRIDGIIGLGGVAKKSPFVMQVVADVLGMPIEVARPEQACALGSAMAAAVAGGVHPTFEEAQKAMSGGIEKVYQPDKKNTAIYRNIYEKYLKLGRFIEQELTETSKI